MAVAKGMTKRWPGPFEPSRLRMWLNWTTTTSSGRFGLEEEPRSRACGIRPIPCLATTSLPLGAALKRALRDDGFGPAWHRVCWSTRSACFTRSLAASKTNLQPAAASNRRKQRHSPWPAIPLLLGN